MPKKLEIEPLLMVLGIAVVLQLALIGIDSRETPVKVAKAFASDYYYLDADMQDYLCTDLAADGESVDQYLHQKRIEANQRGLSINYLRHKFMHIHVQTVQATDSSAEIHLTGTTRVCINPLYMLVGKLFQIGQDYHVDETIKLVKEDGQWRVCGRALGLT